MLKDILTGESDFPIPKTLLLLGLAGIILVLLGDFTGNFTSSSSTKGSKQVKSQATANNLSVEEELENKLERILATVAGVGEVQVDITLDSGSEYIYVRDNSHSNKEIVEEDNNGGTRKTTETEREDKLVVLDSSGSEKPVVRKEIKPKIRGVLVVAEGAANSHIKAELIRAVEVGLGIPSYKIAILPQEG
ncbi:hypothetical protein JCM16358_09150 [Halanaerocella petrolearia]